MSILEHRGIFADLAALDRFKSTIKAYYKHTFHRHGFVAAIADARLIEAHERWVRDLYRVSDIELKGAPLDHFKQSGHLAYWLRRCSPVTQLIVDDEFSPAQRLPERAQNLILRYSNEITAFDVGFRICRYFEAKRADTPSHLVMALSDVGRQQLVEADRKREINSRQTLTYEYMETMGSFLKTKNVSPHAMYLIYKSLFFPLLVFDDGRQDSGHLGD